jgi:hypothetical protein
MASLGVVLVRVDHDGYVTSSACRLPAVLTGLPPGKPIACDNGGYVLWLKIVAVGICQ